MMMMIGPSDPNLSSALKNQCKNLYRIMGFFFFFWVGFQRFFFNVCKCVKVFFFVCVCLCLEVLVVFLSLVLRNREKETEREIWF